MSLGLLRFRGFQFGIFDADRSRNRFQFFGMMTIEYRDQIIPVAVSAVICDMLMFSTGRLMSAKFAPDSAHLNVGAQKWIVNGPAGCIANCATRAGAAEATVF